MYPADPPYPPYPPYPPQPVARAGISVARLIAGLSGAVALLGLLATLLPVLTIDTDLGNQLMPPVDYPETGIDGRITLDFGYYDWISSSFAVAGLIPIALALAAAAGILQAVKGVDRAAFAVTALAGLTVVVVATFTAIRPRMAVHVTGELAQQAGLGGDIGESAGGFSLAPSVIITAVALLVVVGLNAWQWLANRTQPPRLG